MEDLKGKFVLITGASTGIGAAAAIAFAAQGANVAVHYNRSADKAQAVAEAVRAYGVKAMTVAADVQDTGAIDAAVAHVLDGFGRIDVLINNAGSLVKRTPFTEVDDAYFDEVLNVNARSVVAFSRAVVPAMRKQGGGAIVNVTSIAARHGGGPGALIYAAAKGFVSTLTRGMAKELMPDRIRVNAVSPGVIMTPFHEQFSTQAQIDAFRQSIPMGRLGEPDECSGAFLYLASETLAS